MRSFRLALAVSLLGASACSFLLDTDALQKGTGGGGGSGGAGGGTVDGGDGGLSCSSDLDCQPVNTVDACTSYKCGPDKTCMAPTPYTGLGVASVGTNVETVDTSDEIGYPSLLADGTDIVLSFWKRNGTTSNIVIRKYDERPEISPVSADLNSISSNRFDSISSSPGIFIRGIPKRIRLFGAAKPTGVAATGMYQVDIDLANLRISATQPTKADLGVTGYDVNPRGPAPRLLPAGVGEPSGMWIQQGKLYYFDANTTGEVYSAKRVIGFAPLAANLGVHAALETTDLGSTDDQGQTEIWTRNSNILTSLIGDTPGARRRGVATTATAEGAAPFNFILFAYEKAQTPSLFYAVSACDAMQCTAVGGTMNNDMPIGATTPSASSARVANATTDRDMSGIFHVSVPDPTNSSATITAILGGISRITTSADGGATLNGTAMNPSSFVVMQTNAPPSSVGPSSVVMTSGGSMMVAWVERGANQAVLKTRRFQVKTCP